MSTNDKLKELLTSTATLGREARESNEASKKTQATLSDKVESAKDALDEVVEQAGAFDTAMFVNLAKVGGIWARAYNNSDSQASRDAADQAADIFAMNFTGANDVTKIAGGTLKGFVRTITLGTMAETARAKLQAVIARHQDTIKSLKGDKSDSAKARVETAKRYTVVCGESPEYNGSWPVSPKTGKVKMPRHNGRKGDTIEVGDTKVIVEPGRATDRKAQMAAYAILVHTYGDSALDTRVVEAFLDNGGRYKTPEDVSAPLIAARALKEMESLNLAGGNASTDAGIIDVMIKTLRRIAEKGFTDSRASTESNKDDAPDTTDNEPETQTSEPESEVKTPEVLTQGEGVTLGDVPIAANDGKPRAARARKPAAPRAAGRMAS